MQHECTWCSRGCEGDGFSGRPVWAGTDDAPASRLTGVRCEARALTPDEVRRQEDDGRMLRHEPGFSHLRATRLTPRDVYAWSRSLVQFGDDGCASSVVAIAVQRCKAWADHVRDVVDNYSPPATASVAGCIG